MTVVNPAPGGGTSNTVSFTISAPANPVPALTSLAPTSTPAGGAAFTLTVNGSNFVGTSQVHWNGAARTTTVVNAGQVTAAIPASDIVTQGSAQVTVVNPAPGGGTSNALTLTTTAGCPVGEYFAQYYANRTLSGIPALSRCEANVNYNWGTSSPGGGLGANNFSVRWTGRFVFAGGTHTFTARVNDGVRVFVDGSLVINRWVDVASTTPAIYTATSTLAAGEHEVKVEYYERTGVAEIQVSW